MTDQVQTKKPDNEKTKQIKDGVIAQTEEQVEKKSKTVEKQRVIKERIDRVRKSFKSRWLDEQLRLLDNK